MSAKAKSDDGEVLPCAEVKERKIRLVGTISRKVMRSPAAAGGQTPARYGVPAGASAALSVFALQTHLPRLSGGQHERSDLATSQRASGDALPAGSQLRSGLLSLRRTGSLAV